MGERREGTKERMGGFILRLGTQTLWNDDDTNEGVEVFTS